MTDKEQIMIDGIDVSECDHFRGGYCLTGTGVCYKCDTNCQYAAFYLKEQLTRKAQECEALKKRNEDNERFYLKQYAKKDSEVLDLTHKLNVKTQKCEELKKKLNTSEEWRIKAENLNEKQDLENTRYCKALEEIKKHIEDYKKQCNIPNNCIDNRLCSTCFLGGANELGEYILDIINKAKGEGNE